MKKLVKIMSLVLALCLVFSLAGCGNNGKKIESDKDLPGAVIGVQLGTTGDIFATAYEKKGSTIERYNKGADAVLALTQGKIDCVIIDNEPAKAFVEANEGLKILEEAFAVEEYAICVSKENKDLTTSINAALADLKADGTIDKIIKNYIGDDTKGTCPYVSPADVDTSKGELHMATNAFFEPYEFYDGEKVVGIDAMIAQAICDKLGYKLVIDDMEFDAIITAVQTGKSDMGMAGMTVTEDRLQSINFSSSYATGIQSVIVPEGSKIKTVEDLFADDANYLVGTQKGTTGDIYAEGDFGADRVMKYASGNEAVQALVTGKVDCVIIDNEPAKAYVEANNK